MNMEHPDVTEARRHGYPSSQQHRELGEDALGNIIYAGTEVYELDDEVFVVEELISDSIKILETLGAERKVIK